MAKQRRDRESEVNRREFIRRGLYGVGVTAALPTFLSNSSAAVSMQALGSAPEKHPQRILVVLELTGGNDGLNTVVPYTDDEYFRERPVLGVPRRSVRKLDDNVAFNPHLEDLYQMFQEGEVAVVNGCGYPNPILSHFTSMDWWHSGVPHSAEPLGWVGRTASAIRPKTQENFIIQVGNPMAPAVRNGVHPPIVFNDPDRFRRDGSEAALMAAEQLGRKAAPSSEMDPLGYLDGIVSNAATASVLVREAVKQYETPVEYGPAGGGSGTNLKTVAALIAARLPTRFYYVNLGGFDTHASQVGTHDRLCTAWSMAVRGFIKDLERLGRANDVAIMVFSEFGRRVGENSSVGTDHGTAGPMFIIGKPVKGGVYGKHPSLTDLDRGLDSRGGNMKFTTDFRRVYATMIKEWMGYDDTRTLLRGDFPTLGAFA